MAYPENAFLTPEHPMAGDTIVFNALSGPCDVLQRPCETPVVSVAGGKIAVQLSGDHYEDPIFCILGSRIDRVDIGTFPSGSYTVSVSWRFATSGAPTIMQLGVLPLTIGGVPAAEPVSLPASNTSSLLALTLMLLVVVATRPGGRVVAKRR
ncbi:hypothetical protein [Dokdonella sp.]|uniref:hypothetical protein n=1 Tax=Dokdonella sp. TaxID=2291710 RepID=UPI00378461E1